MSHSVAKNTLYLTAASVAQKLLAFVYFLLLARVMRPEATGAYFLALSITTIFSVVADFGITQVIIREVAKKPEETLSLVRRALGLKIPFLACATIGALFTSWALGYGTEIWFLVLIACVVLLADALSLLFYGVLRGMHQLRYESLGVFVGQTCTLLIGGAVLFFHPSLPLLIATLTVGSIFNMIFSAAMVARQLGISVLQPVWDPGLSRAFIRAAIPFALAGIFVKVYSYVDSVFIAKMLGQEAVGMYSIAYKFTYAFQFVPMAFVAALYPGMSAVVGKDPKRLAELFDDAMWYVAVVAMPIAFGIWAVAPDAVTLASDEYAAAAPVLQVLVFALIPIFLDFPIGSLLNASGRQSTKTAIMGVTMLLNIALNALFIPIYGIVGAAYAALGSFTLLLVGGLWYVPQMIPGYSFGPLLRTLAGVTASGLVMGLCASWLRPFIGFLPTIPVAGMIYGILLFATGSVRLSHLKHAAALVRPQRPYEQDAPRHD